MMRLTTSSQHFLETAWAKMKEKSSIAWNHTRLWASEKDIAGPLIQEIVKQSDTPTNKKCVSSKSSVHYKLNKTCKERIKTIISAPQHKHLTCNEYLSNFPSQVPQAGLVRCLCIPKVSTWQRLNSTSPCENPSIPVMSSTVIDPWADSSSLNMTL